MPVVEWPHGLSLPKFGEIGIDKTEINVEFTEIPSLVGTRVQFMFRLEPEKHGENYRVYHLYGRVIEEEQVLGSVDQFATVDYVIKPDYTGLINDALPEIFSFQDKFEIKFHNIEYIEDDTSGRFIEVEDWLKLVQLQQRVPKQTQQFISPSKDPSRRGWFGDRPGHSLAAQGRRVPWKRRRPRA